MRFVVLWVFAPVTNCFSRKTAAESAFGQCEPRAHLKNIAAAEAWAFLAVERPSFDGFVSCAIDDHRN
jgi:hypothetical protein